SGGHPRSPIGYPVRSSRARLDNTLARSARRIAGSRPVVVGMSHPALEAKCMMRRLLLLPGFLVLAGCAFGTNRVNLAAVPSSAMPADGPTTPVEVRDARAELNGTTVGFKRNGYGAKTGSVELANKQPLAERVRSDLISVLRERGYRAGLEESAADLRFDAEILSFIVDVKQGFWSGSLEGLSAGLGAIIWPGNRGEGGGGAGSGGV